MKPSWVSIPCLLAAFASGGCGPSVKTISFGPVTVEHNKPFLVKLIDAAPAKPVEIVSMSVVEREAWAAPQKRPSEDVVATMRRHAGQRGAHYLVIERLDNPWRRAFYGTGLRLLPPGTSTRTIRDCTHESAREGAEDAAKRASRCMDKLRRTRPALKGEVAVLLEVDPFGRVRRAVPTPDSSRDTLMRNCALGAVFQQDFGEPGSWGCRVRVEARL